MNMQIATPATRPALLSTGTRLAAALVVVTFVAASWSVAQHESHAAVQLSAAAMGPKTMYVTLPPVEIVARRESAGTTALAASRAQRNTGTL